MPLAMFGPVLGLARKLSFAALLGCAPKWTEGNPFFRVVVPVLDVDAGVRAFATAGLFMRAPDEPLQWLRAVVMKAAGEGDRPQTKCSQKAMWNGRS